MSRALAKKKSAPKRDRKPKLKLVKPVEDEQPDVITDDLEALPLSPEEDDQLDDVLEVDVTPRIIQPEVKATLVAHCGAVKVSRADLALIAIPEATATFQPIPHTRLIESLEEALAFRHIAIVREEYAVTPDGMRLFAALEINAEYEGVRLAIALRNANDRSMRLSMVAGYRVFCCDNLSMSGDFKPMLAKHSKHFDLIDSLALGVDKIQRGFEPLKRAIDFKRLHPLSDDDAKLLIYRAFMQERFPVTLMKRVHQFYFQPQYSEFEPRTVWSIENAMTSAFKSLKPVRMYELTAKLGKFLAPHSQAF